MKKITFFLCLALTTFLLSCDNKKDNTQASMNPLEDVVDIPETFEEPITGDPDIIPFNEEERPKEESPADYGRTLSDEYRTGYTMGFSAGLNDKKNSYGYKSSFDDEYPFGGEWREYYQRGYAEGYNKGYYQEEYSFVLKENNGVREVSRGYSTNPNIASLDEVSDYDNEYWEEWEDTDFKIYVELQGCESLEEARNYDSSAIEENERFFVPKSIPSGIYEVEIGDKINNKMWKINFTNIFLKFNFNPWLWKWDEGIIDTFGGRGTFYKKP